MHLKSKMCVVSRSNALVTSSASKTSFSATCGALTPKQNGTQLLAIVEIALDRFAVSRHER